jgi:putative endonuclease
MERNYFVYIMTNENNYVLYTGITNDLKRRVFEHRNGVNDGFTKKYRVHKLVYYEMFLSNAMAIAREKQIKAGSRKKKQDLIKAFNPEWRDLFHDVAVM